MFGMCDVGGTNGALFSMRIDINDTYPNARTTGFWPYSQPPTGGSFTHVSGQGILALTAGEYVNIFIQYGTMHGGGGGHNQFWGYFIG